MKLRSGDLLSYSAGTGQSDADGYRVVRRTGNVLRSCATRWPHVAKAVSEALPILINAYPAAIGAFDAGVLVDTYGEPRTASRALQLAHREGLSPILGSQPLFAAMVLLRHEVAGLAWPTRLAIALGGYPTPRSLEAFLRAVCLRNGCEPAIVFLYGVAEVDAACMIAAERIASGEPIYYPRGPEIDVVLEGEELLLGIVDPEPNRSVHRFPTGDTGLRVGDGYVIRNAQRYSPVALKFLESWGHEEWSRRTGRIRLTDGGIVSQLREGERPCQPMEAAFADFPSREGEWGLKPDWSMGAVHAAPRMETTQTSDADGSAKSPPPVSSGGGAFERSLAHFAAPSGRDFLRRIEPFAAWQEERRAAGVWPYSRSLDSAPGPRSTMRAETGEVLEGLNFASQDYLGLSSHPDVADAAVEAIRAFGPHSAGSPALAGNTGLSLALERRLSEFLGYGQVLLYPTGWAAGFGVITGLVRAFDHVIIDVLAHSCLQVGAAAATRNVHRVGHLDTDAVRACLKKIRAREAQSGILVVTEGLFSMDADTPDIHSLLRVSREYGALLLVDVAHDFGSIGPLGKGALAEQGVLGDVDLVMGSFSKTFASNGGFVATHSHAVRQYLKYYSSPCIFSNAISPVACAIISESLRIVAGPEGDERRAQLMRAVGALRSGLETRGIRPMGRPSPIVPVPVGDEKVGRLSSSLLASRHSVFANFVEFPAVGIGQARYRFQVMASHSVEQADSAAGAVVDSMAEARRRLANGGTID